ncbi:hypothetical protein [Hymenobacter negativus]|uniref:Uncharacterized protein n=1 Tax=Hymenobacter negativus TaxID=2795026 RepID=A0ABS3QFV4_9BACT|nr:hypothetical protein [Hymenobacter negativus]MBO2009863.1 hypothetical protein [Hymenobacter negativus]
MSPFSTPETSPADLLAAFEHRVLTRDEPTLPEPLRFDAVSVQERVRRALHQQLGQRDPRRLRSLAIICYQFLGESMQLSTAPTVTEALALSGAPSPARGASCASRGWW